MATLCPWAIRGLALRLQVAICVAMLPLQVVPLYAATPSASMPARAVC
jgi:hypothetical protein